MRPRFEPDEQGRVADLRLGDAESFEASQQRLEASLELKSSPPRFIVEGWEREQGFTEAGAQSVLPRHSEPDAVEAGQQECFPGSLLSEAAVQQSAAWREEVAARVSQYRARRRPRAPRYPSLLLKFDPPPPLNHGSRIEALAVPKVQDNPAAAESARAALAFQHQALAVQSAPSPAIEPTARIIEFPRSAAAPVRPVDELAEPVLDIPRILDVPEPQPLPPAMGGIAIESPDEPADEKRRGFELPLQPASFSRRVLAGVIDVVLVLVASAMFGAIVLKIAGVAASLPQTAEVFTVVTAMIWGAYQYLLLARAGATVGLKMAKLQLSLFDGSPVPRKLRSWRVIASLLSGVSLALGYAWCFLDEDQLCWHDRITHTYIAEC